MARAVHANSALLMAFSQKCEVMGAVMLRDMRTRFFNHGLGFLVSIAWPLVHMLVILTVFTLSGRAAPYGDNARIFFATGLIPTLAFMYVSRFMAISLVLNRPMLAFPVVHILDIVMARAVLEIISAALTLSIIVFILWMLGDDPSPIDPADALLCYLTTLLLAVGIGIIASVITLITTAFITVYALLMIIVYLSSGTVFAIHNFPNSIATILSYSPIIQSTEWMRVAYYQGYSDEYLNRTYLLLFAICTLCVGLILERLTRGTAYDN